MENGIIRDEGGETVLILPKGLKSRYNLTSGVSLPIIAKPEGFQIVIKDEFEETLEKAMSKYDKTLRLLS